ncbi:MULTISPECIES: CvpA family protein [Rhodovulum]|uniref:Membrane protein required for colicin V production n=2 Tax=Rhodovulum TaxID=34008 RepID=A0A8E2VK67_9RHOB|nr:MULTISPECIES: CvpA family protein [Rhodovulum]PTW47150.1 membrane protein required for colicin V production [Rhodovulum kholense]RAP41493.1 colicin V production CvpA [Rhodovulum viride]
MDSFTVVDGIVAAVILVSAVLAYSRGVVREVMAIAGWIIAAIVAFTFAPQAEPLVREIPYLGDFIGSSCEIAILASFAAVFAAALVVVSLFTPLLSSMIQGSVLGGVDQSLGFLFGAVRGALLVAVAFFVYGMVITDHSFPAVENSRSSAVFASLTAKIAETNPDQALGWLTTQYEQLVGTCGAPQ